MQWATLLLKDVLVELVKALAWPAALLCSLYMFRGVLRRLTEALARRIPRMKSASVGTDGAKAEFEPEIVSLPSLDVDEAGDGDGGKG